MHGEKIELGAKFDNSFEGVPPHMSPEDHQIWKRYKKEFGHLYDYYHYDCCFPSLCKCPEHHPNSMKKMWNSLTGKRLDALCHASDCWTIVECRIHASLGALGAAIAYRHLWGLYKPNELPCKIVIVTDNIDLDSKLVADHYNIGLICV